MTILGWLIITLLAVPASKADCSDYQNSIHWVYGMSFWSYVPGGDQGPPTRDVAQAENGTKIFVANLGGLMAFEEVSPGHYTPGDSFNDVQGARSVEAVGDRAYVVGLPHGFWVIDTTNPSNLLLVATVDVPDAERVTVSGSYAYVRTMSEITIVRIAGIGPITVVGHLPGIARDVAVRGNRAYVTTDEGLRVADVSNPANPFYIQTVYASDNLLDVIAQDNYLYVADGDFGLRVFDLGNPNSPVLVGSCPTPGRSTLIVGGNHAMLGGGGGITHIDIQNPTAPTAGGTYRGLHSLRGGAIDNRTAFLADAYYGLQVLDLADGTMPVPIASIPGSAGAVQIHWNGSTMVSVLTGNALQTLDVSNPGAPVPLGSLAMTYPRAMAVEGNYAYVIEGWDFKVVDLSVPAAPTVVGVLPGVNGDLVSVSAGRAYVLWRGTATLSIVDVQNPTSPALLMGTNFFQWSDAAIAEGTTLYTANNFEGSMELWKWDVSDPNHIQFLDGSMFGNSVTDLAFDQGKLLIASDRALYAVDPNVMWQADFVRDHPFGGELAVGANGRVYTVNSDGGFNMFSRDGLLHYTGSGAVPSSPLYRAGIAEVAGYLYVGDGAGLRVFDPACGAASAPELSQHFDDPRIGSAPNPFSRETAIRFDMPQQAVVDLRIFDASGRVVRTLLAGSTLLPGVQTVNWDGRDDRGRSVSAGVFFARLATPTWSRTQRIERLR
jgi:hypothetical protein